MSDILGILKIKDENGNWVNVPGLKGEKGDNPTAAEIQTAVDAWLTDHPEVTTTVEDGSLTKAKFSDALKAEAIKDYVTPQMYGAKGDGVTDDTSAFTSAISSGKPVLVPIGTYMISDTIKTPNECTIIGADRCKTILTFSDGVNGIQMNRRASISNLTISISGDAAGLYIFIPELFAVNQFSTCQNIIINHRSNTIDGAGILLVAQSSQNISGAFNISFKGIDIVGDIEYGIHLLAKVKTTARYETYFTDIIFEDIFISASKIAIISDWEDISGTDAVPQTGQASIFGGIKFIGVSAQCKIGVSTCFCKIMNIYDCTFTDCTPFDYYNILTSTNAAYVFNATSGMCLIDLGFLPEINYDLTRWFKFENQNTFNDAFKRVVRFLNTPNENKSYGLFYNHVTSVSGSNLITLTDTENSSIITAAGNICGNIVSAILEIRLPSLGAGNNNIGKLKISPNQNIYAIGFYGSSAAAGTPIRLVINSSGDITAVCDSAISTQSVLRCSLIYIRKYYLYS